MTANDFLMFLYHYRDNPTPGAVPHIFLFIRKERLLHFRDVAIAVSGAITAFCARHKEQLEDWERDYADLIARAHQIARARDSRNDIRWGDHLMYRWMILATDREAWELLCLAHSGTEHQRTGARAAIDKICRSIDAVPMHDSKGNLVGKVYFEDMRLQMTRLAKEYSKLSPGERRAPFDSIIWSEETRAEQVRQQVSQQVPVIQVLQ